MPPLGLEKVNRATPLHAGPSAECHTAPSETCVPTATKTSPGGYQTTSVMAPSTKLGSVSTRLQTDPSPETQTAASSSSLIPCWRRSSPTAKSQRPYCDGTHVGIGSQQSGISTFDQTRNRDRRPSRRGDRYGVSAPDPVHAAKVNPATAAATALVSPSSPSSDLPKDGLLSTSAGAGKRSPAAPSSPRSERSQTGGAVPPGVTMRRHVILREVRCVRLVNRSR